MDEIDKQIDAIIEKLELSGNYGDDTQLEDDALWLIDQLKACRENEDTKKIAKYIANLEHRTKETCLGAAWKWMKQRNPHLLPQFRTKLSIAFDKAIEEARTK